jgi:hypothetical protein
MYLEDSLRRFEKPLLAARLDAGLPRLPYSFSRLFPRERDVALQNRLSWYWRVKSLGSTALPNHQARRDQMQMAEKETR